MQNRFRPLLIPGVCVAVGMLLGTAVSCLWWKDRQVEVIIGAPSTRVCTGFEIPASAAQTSQPFPGAGLDSLLSATKWPAQPLAEFSRDLEDGKVSPETLTRLLDLLAAKWPEEVMHFASGIDPAVAATLRVKSMALAKLAAHHPAKAVALLSTMPMQEFEGRELYDIGLHFMKKGAMPAEWASLLTPEMVEALSQAAAESVLRAEGVSGLVQWVGNLESTTVKKYDTTGNLLSEQGGPTLFALDRLSEFLKQTSTVDQEQVFAALSSPAYRDNALESTAAFKVLAQINPLRALETAASLTGTGAHAAERGAFIQAAQSDSEIALKYLSQITDPNKQGNLLELLAAYTPDPQIKQECETILIERKIQLPVSK